MLWGLLNLVTIRNVKSYLLWDIPVRTLMRTHESIKNNM